MGTNGVLAGFPNRISIEGVTKNHDQGWAENDEWEVIAAKYEHPLFKRMGELAQKNGRPRRHGFPHALPHYRMPAPSANRSTRTSMRGRCRSCRRPAQREIRQRRRPCLRPSLTLPAAIGKPPNPSASSPSEQQWAVAGFPNPATTSAIPPFSWWTDNKLDKPGALSTFGLSQ